MGGSRVQVNKAHKTRFSSKSSRQVHKTSLQGGYPIANFLFFFSFWAFIFFDWSETLWNKEKKTMLKKILNLVFSDIMHPL